MRNEGIPTKRGIQIQVTIQVFLRNRIPCEYDHNSFRFTFFPSPINTTATATKHYCWTTSPLLFGGELNSKKENKNKGIACGCDFLGEIIISQLMRASFFKTIFPSFFLIQLWFLDFFATLDLTGTGPLRISLWLPAQCLLTKHDVVSKLVREVFFNFLLSILMQINILQPI